MKTLAWIVAGLSVTVLVLVIVDGTKVDGIRGTGPADPDVEGAAAKAGAWGAKQRVTGTGGSLLGKVKQGAGRALGDDQLEGEGALDQIVGSVKDAAGQVASAAGEGLHKANTQTY